MTGLSNNRLCDTSASGKVKERECKNKKGDDMTGDRVDSTENRPDHSRAGEIQSSALEDRTIRRGIIVAEGDLIACQTRIEGTFTGPFTHSPVGKLEPNGARVVWDLMSIFRFDDRGRLVEEFVRTDNRSFLRQLGAEVA